MTTFIPGEIVNATINGARVISVHNDEFDRFVLTVEYANDSEIEQIELLPDNDAIAIERVAPKEWPPQSGDKWRDAAGGPWFAVDVTDWDADGEPRVDLFSANQYNCGSDTPDKVNQQYGPMVLVHREDAKPGEVTA